MIRTNKLILPAVILILFSACNNATNTNPPEEDTATGESRIMPPADAFPEFFRYLKAQDTSFSAFKFEGVLIEQRDSFLVLPLETGQLKPFLPYLIYSPDSTKAIDMISYNYIPVEKKGRIIFEEAGPDFEVSVIDFATNTKKRLLFFGTMGGVTDAKWEDNNTVLLVGATQWEQHAFSPALWRFRLNDTGYEQFEYPGSIHADPGNYLQRRLPAGK